MTAPLRGDPRTIMGRRSPGSSMPLLRALTAFALAWGAMAQQQRPERVPGAAVDFHMASYLCPKGFIPDWGNMYIEDLRLNASATGALCHPAGGNGLVNLGPAHDEWAGGTLVRSGNFAPLHNSGTRNATVEVWFTPAANSTNSTEQTIFAITRPWAATDSTGEWATMALVQQDAQLQLILRVMSGSTPTWLFNNEPWPINPSTPPAAIHVAIIVGWRTNSAGGNFRFLYDVYINGQIRPFTASTILEAPRPFWNAGDRLYLFSPPPVDGAPELVARPWRGTIHYFAIYDRNLTATEVQQNYQAGVFSSPPQVLNITRTVQRDGEDGTHYDTPEFYLAPIPATELAMIPLPALDADEEPGSPNYNNMVLAYSIEVDSLPDKGALFFLNGTEITTVPTLVARITPQPGDDFATATAYLRYRPRWREVSAPDVYTTFTFVAIDGVTGLRSDPATVRVIVTPTHDIPNANPNLTADAVARVPLVIQLNGTASGGASITTAFVARLPAQGELYQVHPSNGSVALAEGPIALPQANSGSRSGLGAALWGLAAVYVYTGPEDGALAADGTLATDGFAFRVGDNVTAVSLPANVSVAVRPAVAAVAASEEPSAVEGGPVEVVVRATGVLLEYHDASVGGLNGTRVVWLFEITALPRHGTLQRPDTGAAIEEVGERLLGHAPTTTGGAYTASATITYQAAPGFFTWPPVAWDGGALVPVGEEGEESFAFRMLACNATGGACATSQPVTQPVRVVNRNDPTAVTAPAGAFSVLALGSLGACGGAGAGEEQQQQQQQQQEQHSRPDLLTITGWTVDDPDRGVDPVVVRLEAQYGILRLNPSHLALADFTSTRFCHAAAANWTCQGSGEDRRMVFVASPQNLLLLLNGLEYQCARPHVRDTVTLTVFDGAHDDEAAGAGDEGVVGCLPGAAFNNTADRSNGCLETTASFTVDVGESALIECLHPSRASSSSVPQALWLAAIALGAYVLLAAGTCWWRARRRRMRVGAVVSGADGGADGGGGANGAAVAAVASGEKEGTQAEAVAVVGDVKK